MFPTTLTQEQALDPEIEANYLSVETFPGEITTVHKHDFFEFMLVTAGSIELIVNNRLTSLSGGSLTLVRPGETHYFQSGGKSDCALVCTIFSRRVFEQLAACLGADIDTQRLLMPDNCPCVRISPRQIDRVRVQLEQLDEIPIDQKVTLRLRLRLFLLELLIAVLQPPPGAVHPDQPLWMQELIRVMQLPENYLLGFSRMRQLATVSPEHMSRSFRRFLNVTPTEFVGKLRLNHAANMLAHTDRRINLVATESGFESVSHFYQLFHQKFGSTPAEYRKDHQKSLLPAG